MDLARLSNAESIFNDLADQTPDRREALIAALRRRRGFAQAGGAAAGQRPLRHGALPAQTGLSTVRKRDAGD
jgi:hypothetical protein